MLRQISSLRNKFLVGFVLVGLLPFVILLSYTIFLSETKIVNKIVDEQLFRSNNVIQLIENQMILLKQEVAFISSLDVMDDILADDIDKRISILLSKKTTDFSIDMSLMVLNRDATIIASSSKELLLQQFFLSAALAETSFIDNGYIYISSKIYASFDKTKEIGYLVLKYKLQNLDSYLTHRKGIHSYIFSLENGVHFGDKVELKFDISKKKSAITDKHVIVYKSLKGRLKGYYLVYAVDKEIALKFLYDFTRFMMYVAVVVFILIIFIAVKYSRGIVKPIEDLTNATRNIIRNQDYTSTIEIHSKDEIATLSFAFNEMLETTKNALKSLEDENKLRVQRFTQLIEVFNKIIQTENEEKCISTSKSEIQKITQREDLHFSRKRNQDGIAIYVTDFSKNEKVYFGTISLKHEEFEDLYEKQFYHSIAAMISLQLDHIRLIEQTKNASNAKSTFISTMSHELRTPLNSIIGATQFLLSYEAMSDTQQDSVATIESSAHYLLGMINEILDIAKIEAGVMEVKKESVAIQELLQNSYTILQPLADDKDLALELDLGKLSEKMIETDGHLLQQIVINLLSNAIKFTQEGSVKILAYTQDNTLFIKVIDSGVGIEKKSMQKLFHAFSQVDNVMQKKHKGTGLGLALSQKMAQLLDGDVSLESEGLNTGVTATLYLPYNNQTL